MLCYEVNYKYTLSCSWWEAWRAADFAMCPPSPGDKAEVQNVLGAIVQLLIHQSAMLLKASVESRSEL